MVKFKKIKLFSALAVIVFSSHISPCLATDGAGAATSSVTPSQPTEKKVTHKATKKHKVHHHVRHVSHRVHSHHHHAHTVTHPQSNPNLTPVESEKSLLSKQPVPLPTQTPVTGAKKVVKVIDKTVATTRYSVYKLGGTHFDMARGIYVVDCSHYVDHVLKVAAPHAYNSLVNSTGSPSPSSAHYYDFFKSLSYQPKHYWNTVKDVEQLRPGDILVFRYKNPEDEVAGGHVMVVMNKPVQRSSDGFLVKVADSASARHSHDTRPAHTSGIGIGTMQLKVNPDTGKPDAYSWGDTPNWESGVNFAMARPVDV